jgi:hypothetical protein
MFTKLNTVHNLSLQESRELKYQYGKIVDGVWYGISYYKAELEIESKLKSIVPEKHRKLFDTTLMIITSPYIQPHIDNNITMAINFYMETGDAVTCFHKTKEEVKTNIEVLPEQTTTGKLFLFEDLDIVNTFKANRNEVYLLNVGEIHSVYSSTGSYREAYCLQSNKFTYQQMLDMLEEEEVLLVE